MQSKAKTIEEYLSNLPEERKQYFEKLMQVIQNNIPKGFEKTISYGFIGYVVPHSLYSAGYHCTPELPLPFISLANQKWFIAFYHMWMYADEELSNWFIWEYEKVCKYKLDMWKSCVRFKKMDDIPYELIWELVKKMSVKDWIKLYEKRVKN